MNKHYVLPSLPFPFPSPEEATRERIRELGEQLDAHRKRQQALHPGLTLTGMYNVLEKLRALDQRAAGVAPADQTFTFRSNDSHQNAAAGQTENSGELALPAGRSVSDRPREHVDQLTAKGKLIHEQGLVSVLKQIHDDLDAAVFHAYGWDDLVSCSGGLRPSLDSGNSGAETGAHRDAATIDVDEIFLERLVALNHERAEEEKRGIIRWLRPEFQNPEGASASSPTLELPEEEETESPKSEVRSPKVMARVTWPKTLSEQVEAVRKALESSASPVTAQDLAKQFQRANKDCIAEILETLVALGKARETETGKYKG